MDDQTTYLFYDLETSGLSKAFDQVLEFAAIRTDLELNELERTECLVKFTRGVAPDLEAFLTHRLNPVELNLRGVSEAVAVDMIHACLNQPGTISVGYNSLGFDDEFLRMSFYRHLRAPYTHQFANGCGRFDLYPMVALYSQVCPQALDVWPVDIDQTQSLKLDALAQANGFLQGEAHRAMSDVETTIELAKRLKAHTKIWDYCLAQFTKMGDQASYERLTPWSSGQAEYALALMIDGRIGAHQQFKAPTLGFGQHHHYRNQSIWLRLDQNIAEMLSAGQTPRVVRHKAGEPQFLLPLAGRHLAQCSESTQAQINLNLEFLGHHPSLLSDMAKSALEHTYPKIENIDVEAGLYQAGFLNAQEVKWSQAFHAHALDERSALLDEAPTTRLMRLAQRYLWRYAGLDDASGSVDQFGLDYVGQPKRSLESVRTQIENFRNDERCCDDDLGLLQGLERCLFRVMPA